MSMCYVVAEINRYIYCRLQLLWQSIEGLSCFHWMQIMHFNDMAKTNDLSLLVVESFSIMFWHKCKVQQH